MTGKRIITGTQARAKVTLTNRAGEVIRPGDLVTISEHKVRAGTVTVYRPKAGISGVTLDELELIP